MTKLVRTRFATFTFIALSAGLTACTGAGAPAVAEDEPAALSEPYVAHPSTPMSCANNGRDFHCKGRIRTDVAPQLQPEAVTAGFGPADLAAAYALDTSLKPNATIAIVDAFSYPNAESDLAAYRSKYNLPACTVASGCLTIVNQQGNTSPLPSLSPPNDDWTVETALDLDMASAACPNCKLLLIQADSDSGSGLMQSQATAAALGATVISNSWGGPESTRQPGSAQESFFTLNKPIAIFVAAGDDGYDDGGSGPDYPSVSAHVIGVGATSLVKSTNARGWSETAWSTSPTEKGAGGSSCSVSIPKPSYQANLNTQCTHRAAADLAAVGDPATGVAVYNKDAGGFIIVGGTSAASPFVAGVFALYGHGGADPSFPYSNTAAFFDVSSGSNGTCGNILCNAAKGWDGPTGVGTPNGALLAPAAASVDMGPAAPAATPDMTPAPSSNTIGTLPESGNSGGTTSGSGDTTVGGTSSHAIGGIGCDVGGAAAAGGGWLWTVGLAVAATLRRRRNRR